jgi:hypothetical protein
MKIFLKFLNFQWTAALSDDYSHRRHTPDLIANRNTEMTPIDIPDDDVDSQKSSKRKEPREVICPITGYHVVARRPGQRSITTEEIREMLEEFP